MYDFANILFAGPCNLRCPYCIGKQLKSTLNRNNLNEFPLQNLDRFVDMLQQYGVSQVVLTGTTTDPQLYRYEARLLIWLRSRLQSVLRGTKEKRVHYSLHTNGQLALRKMVVLNQYDRVCISFPSFEADTYHRMMGSPKVPDLAEIMRQAEIPVKVSAVVNEYNINEIEAFLARCGELGIKRVVLRQLYGDTRQWSLLPNLSPTTKYCNNPVYHYHGMEITVWQFQSSTSTSLNLFSNGIISTEYLLAKEQGLNNCPISESND